MSGTTPGGLPYPSGTDLVRDGDNAIKALAEKVEWKYGQLRQSYIGGMFATGPDGRVWCDAPNLSRVDGAVVNVVGDNNWYAKPIMYSGNMVLVAVWDGNHNPTGNIGVAINGWAYGI